jgi:hypothetical protein
VTECIVAFWSDPALQRGTHNRSFDDSVLLMKLEIRFDIGYELHGDLSPYNGSFHQSVSQHKAVKHFTLVPTQM